MTTSDGVTAVRWTFRKVVSRWFGRTIYRDKCMHVEHIGYDGHDRIPPGQGCNECGWINLPEHEASRG